jgi:hypothetical protein
MTPTRNEPAAFRIAPNVRVAGAFGQLRLKAIRRRDGDRRPADRCGGRRRGGAAVQRSATPAARGTRSLGHRVLPKCLRSAASTERPLRSEFRRIIDPLLAASIQDFVSTSCEVPLALSRECRDAASGCGISLMGLALQHRLIKNVTRIALAICPFFQWCVPRSLLSGFALQTWIVSGKVGCIGAEFGTKNYGKPDLKG